MHATGDPAERRNIYDSGAQIHSPACSEDAVETASSCYSRRTSVTSFGSDPIESPYKSADAFSVNSPTAAGVFDDDAALVHCSASRLVVKKPSLAEVRNKPLPREPPIELAPLPPSRNRCGGGFGASTLVNDKVQNARPPPTLSQAAEELENVLAGITRQRQHGSHSSQSAPLLNSPLQISRGNMDMIATRPAPKPPTNIAPASSISISQQKSFKRSPRDLRRTMKRSPKNKGAFSLMPSFSRKYSSPHLRSFSSSTLKSDVESQPFRVPHFSETIEDDAANGSEVAELPGLVVPSQRQRPSSFCSERELRLKLPRLQTKQVRSHEDLISSSSSAGDKSNTDNPVHTPGSRPDNVEEKIFISSSRPGRSCTLDSLCELEGAVPQRMTLPQEMVFELDAGLPSPQVKVTVAVHLPRDAMTGHLPDDIVMSIMEAVSSLDDLFNLATVCKQYYRVFKRHELHLMRNTLFRMSPPAWELREMSPPWDSEWQILVDPDAPVPEYTPALYLQRYAQDIYTLAQLKSLILARCNTFVRQETINGLTGKDETRATEIDDAFWRIWTFCRIFGCGKNRENDIMGQMDWLNGGIIAKDCNSIVSTSVTEPFGMNNVLFEPPAGFGRGNAGGLSQSQLYDITEIWTCLGVLLQPIHGQREEARKVGIFDGLGIAENDTVKEEATIEEWTYYVLTLGPSAVLSIGSICPVDNAEVTFRTARSVGLTKWEPSDSDISRSTFIKEAVSRTYKAREGNLSLPSSRSSRLSNASSRSSGSSSSQENSSQTNTNSTDSKQSNRRRQAVFAAQLRSRRAQQQNAPGNPITFADERPISSYALIMRRLEGLPCEQQQQQPPPLPNQAQAFSSTAQIPRYCPPPVQYFPPLPPPPPPTATWPAPAVHQPQVLDPVDQAIHMMTHELGFREEDAKWALKITDSGEGIDANAAIALLMREHTKCEKRRNSRFSFRSKNPTVLESVIKSKESLNSGWRWA
ncbi:F-box domain protein [Aspergillus clavatus NRRL 1]|uniref:F-box domain protein n=1 Tax=Aspergillus clavatus (strain ATCC 1007 / CBS 513.65 / DSM 816 / NCTC 3887 / NRRL 1 / QM 1276 / 107) TaxID=344612 RepID=A1CMF0_ASPCL|nr:F-box domain protein [Aspergillus clavatus NRRL 1]EAW08737.1 F-box domain protein [Aspergillus clavatus NRRL 1]